MQYSHSGDSGASGASTATVVTVVPVQPKTGNYRVFQPKTGNYRVFQPKPGISGFPQPKPGISGFPQPKPGILVISSQNRECLRQWFLGLRQRFVVYLWGLVHPDPYHGLLLGSAPCPSTPLPGYHYHPPPRTGTHTAPAVVLDAAARLLLDCTEH